jgi:hypothetical protein
MSAMVIARTSPVQRSGSDHPVRVTPGGRRRYRLGGGAGQERSEDGAPPARPGRPLINRVRFECSPCAIRRITSRQLRLVVRISSCGARGTDAEESGNPRAAGDCFNPHSGAPASRSASGLQVSGNSSASRCDKGSGGNTFWFATRSLGSVRKRLLYPLSYGPAPSTDCAL